MSGIVFMKTKQLESIHRFYTETIGCDLWLDQGGCVILQHGNLLLGFCAADTAETGGILTFFYPSDKDVDRMYERLAGTSDAPPRHNDRYRIYQFFARDPEDRVLEFQYFMHPVAGHLTGAELLMHRRSVREFLPDPVPEPLLMKLLDICRYSPTSMNSQSFQFRFVTHPDDRVFLGSLRGPASAPIARAPMAVAIFTDPSKTKRPEQDADIAAYHFILAAHHLGLGTCWIAAMNRDDAKERLGIPIDCHVSTIVPVGFPMCLPQERPARRNARQLCLFPEESTPDTGFDRVIP